MIHVAHKRLLNKQKNPFHKPQSQSTTNPQNFEILRGNVDFSWIPSVNADSSGIPSGNADNSMITSRNMDNSGISSGNKDKEHRGSVHSFITTTRGSIINITERVRGLNLAHLDLRNKLGLCAVKAAQILLPIILIYLVTIIPYTLLNIMLSSGQWSLYGFPQSAYIGSVLLLQTNAFLSAIFYGFTNKRLRQGLMSLLADKCKIRLVQTGRDPDTDRGTGEDRDREQRPSSSQVSVMADSPTTTRS